MTMPLDFAPGGGAMAPTRRPDRTSQITTTPGPAPASATRAGPAGPGTGAHRARGQYEWDPTSSVSRGGLGRRVRVVKALA